MRGDAVPMCGSWGRGCVMQLCLKSTSPTGELSERGASLFCPTDGGSSVCKASPCSWSCKCSSLSYRSRSGLTDSGKERGSLDCEQNSVLREASPASSPVLPPHLETGSDPSRTWEDAEDQQSSLMIRGHRARSSRTRSLCCLPTQATSMKQHPWRVLVAELAGDSEQSASCQPLLALEDEQVERKP